MGTVKQIDIKNRTSYFYNDIIDIKTFDSNLLKINKKSYKDIGYITIKKIDDYENIYSVNSLYLTISHARGYIEEKRVNKYLIFDSMELHSINENKELLKKYNDVFNGIRNKIKIISGDECDYEKDNMKLKFNSDDDLPLNKLKFHNMIITTRSVFEDGKLYSQVFLDDTLYELNV